jgi:hypothetical protein
LWSKVRPHIYPNSRRTWQVLNWNTWVSLLLKIDLLKEFPEVRCLHVGTVEARLFREPISQVELEPAEDEGCKVERRFPLLVHLAFLLFPVG